MMAIYDVSLLGTPTSTFLSPPESSKLRLRGLKKSTQPSTLAMADGVKGAKHKHIWLMYLVERRGVAIGRKERDAVSAEELGAYESIAD